MGESVAPMAAGRFDQSSAEFLASAEVLASGNVLVRLDRRWRLLRSGRCQLPIALGRKLAPTGHHASGTGRDQPADDDVLLEAAKPVNPPGNRRLGHPARRLLP